MESMTVELTIRTIEKLKFIGKKGENYDDIIQHLIDEVDYEAFIQKQYKILDEEDEWISLDEL
ncbi:MAG: hypothetical protein K8R25_05495 [Methanosarcinales archaeon]|nr:hypothetical protein [Methanosarcinales archaeon]